MTKSLLQKRWNNLDIIATYAQGFSRGMTLAWNIKKVQMNQFWTTKGTITGHFAYIVTSTIGFITNVYGLHKTLEKLQFIVDLNLCATLTMGNHWIIGGDYNMIKSLEEKKGGIHRLEADNLAFT